MVLLLINDSLEILLENLNESKNHCSLEDHSDVELILYNIIEVKSKILENLRTPQEKKLMNTYIYSLKLLNNIKNNKALIHYLNLTDDYLPDPISCIKFNDRDRFKKILKKTIRYFKNIQTVY